MRRRLWCLCAAVVCTAVAALSGGVFVVADQTIAGGGGRASGGAFVLDGTIGQPDAAGSMTGGPFALAGGFWPGLAVPSPDGVFADGFESP